MLSHDMLIPLVVFVSITLGTWVALGTMSARPRRAEDRLRKLMDGTAGRDAVDAGVARRQEIFQAKVAAAANKLGQSLRPSDQEELGKVRLKLLNAGFRQEQAVAVFFGIKLILMLLGLGIAFPIVALKFGMTRNAMTMTVMAGGLGFYLPGMVVDSRKKKRAEG